MFDRAGEKNGWGMKTGACDFYVPLRSVRGVTFTSILLPFSEVRVLIENEKLLEQKCSATETGNGEDNGD